MIREMEPHRDWERKAEVAAAIVSRGLFLAIVR
jgi:hypothetical protein